VCAVKFYSIEEERTKEKKYIKKGEFDLPARWRRHFGRPITVAGIWVHKNPAGRLLFVHEREERKFLGKEVKKEKYKCK